MRSMTKSGNILLGLMLWLMCAETTQAFSLLGRGNGAPPAGLFPAWQTADYDGLRLDYDFPDDIGGPMMRPDEGYRWNLPLITYAFDQSFINYFGLSGVRAVEEAIRVYSSLPPMSQIQSDGFSFFINGQPVPFNSTFQNTEAQAFGLLDVKSTAMHFLIEELGLAEPERFAWALASREVFNLTPDPDITNYIVINLNFDPITLRRTNMVNGILYGYQVREVDADPEPDFAEAFETVPALSEFPFTSVAGGRSVLTVFGGTSFGFFQGNAGRIYTGLTHDDVGGLRWLYHPRNFAVENLETNVVFGTPVGGRGSPWQPFFGTSNVIGTNVLINTNLLVREGLRGGMNKFRFQRVNYDSLLGRVFVPITNRWVDQFITNGQVTVQPVQRVITQPDIVFTAERLGLDDNFFPFLFSRTTTANWQNNDAINGIDVEVDGGPGVIQPPIVMRFTDQLPFYFNTTATFFFSNGGIVIGSGGLPTETNHVQSVLWGSFDETSTPPIIYPQYGNITLQDLRRFAVGGGN
jgi:hypothetical protein